MNEDWKRATGSSVADIKYRVDAAQKDLQAQRQGVDAGMTLLPKRIEDVDAASKLLPYPVSGTTYTALPALQSVAANTWTKVQGFTLAAPVEKKNAQLFLTCTGLIRTSNSYALGRVIVNGEIFPVFPVSQTGFAVAGGSYTGVIDISVELLIPDPSTVTNDATAGRENSLRTFTMAVWT